MKDENKSSKKVLGVLKVLLLFFGLISSLYFATYSSNPHDSKIKAEEIVATGELLPGEVGFSKTATLVTGMVNQWDIKLRIETKNQFPPPATDIVLLIDTSGSMDTIATDGMKRMDKAKLAAEQFIEQVLNDGYINRIALVTYDRTAKNYTFSDAISGWNNQFVDPAHRDILIKTIKELEPTGGTNTQSGIKVATEVMKKGTSSRRNIVLISDGVPTYSYPPTEPYNTVAGMEKFIHPNPDIASEYTTYQTVKTIPSDYFTYDDQEIIGIGNSYLSIGRFPYFPIPADPHDRVYANHANSAIAQAEIAKTKQNSSGEKVVTDFYTIGLDMDLQATPGDITVGNETMKEIASSPEKCFSVSSDDLAKIMTEIGEQIVGVVRDVKLTETLETGFELANTLNSSNISQGKIAIDNNTKKITWEIGTLTKPISAKPNEDVMFAELTYRVNATNAVLGVGGIDANGEAKTNKDARVDYQDHNDQIQQEILDLPKVKPIIVGLEKKLFDEKGVLVTNATNAFKVTYGADEFTKNDSFSIYSNGDVHRTVHPWRANVDYAVEEQLPTSSGYATEININKQVTGGTKAIFQFNNSSGEYDHQQIVITNRKIVEKKTVHLNIRQSVVQPHEELVIPSKGYYRGNIGSATKQVNLISESTTKDTAEEIEENLFTKYEIVLLKDQGYYLVLSDIVPEYYRFYGLIATGNKVDLKTKHLSTNITELITENEAKLDYEASDSYWLTMFITPEFGEDSQKIPEESPKSFSWSYKTNYFGN